MKRKKSMTGSIIETGVGNLVGIGMIGATASMANELPAGTAKTITGIVPGLQSVALVGHNVKGMGFGKGPRRMRKHKYSTAKKIW